MVRGFKVKIIMSQWVLCSVVRNCFYLSLLWFYGIPTMLGYLMPNLFYTYTYIRYIWCFFFDISTIVGYLMSKTINTYALNTYDLVLSDFTAYQHWRLLNAKSGLYICIRYIWFGLVGFCGISTTVDYLMPNPVHTYILDIYDLVWLGFVAYQQP